MRSCTAAVELYKSVAERGRWGLLLSEAYAHYQEKRYSNALILYLLLSELGYEAAQSNAAFMLERGEIGDQVYALLNGSSVTPNGMLSKALQQWARSASQGYSPARVRLGDYYYYGWGTNKDYGNAATQYRVASETNRNAQVKSENSVLTRGRLIVCFFVTCPGNVQLGVHAREWTRTETGEWLDT